MECLAREEVLESATVYANKLVRNDDFRLTRKKQMMLGLAFQILMQACINMYTKY